MIHVFSVIHTVCKEKPQSFYVNVVDGVARFVEVISNRFIFAAFNAKYNVRFYFSGAHVTSD